MKDVIHCGWGSDLVALCGKMLGISGHDQVRLSYVADQVTCVDCLRIKVQQLKERVKVVTPDDMTAQPCEVPPTFVCTKEMWDQAAGELRGFARALGRGNAGITASQLKTAVVLADLFWKFYQTVFDAAVNCEQGCGHRPKEGRCARCQTFLSLITEASSVATMPV